MAVAESQASSRIFISYRREDSIAHVNALVHPLRERFGQDRLFKDTDSIAPGQDFLKAIQSQLESCPVFLAVIGSKWLTVQKPKSNTRRLDDPTDYLRVEVATALRNEKIRVIPILVGQASMPAPEDLPADLAELARRNGFELRDSRWDSDVTLLIQAIERAFADLASAGPNPPVPPSLPLPGGGASPSSPDTGQFDLLEARRKRQIAEHVKVAREAFEALDYEAVLEACEKAVWLDGQHGEARDLARRARMALDEKKIERWLAQAQQLLAGEELTDADLATASELIDQTLSLNATLEAAVKLRQGVLALRKRRERQREVDRHVRAALVRAQASFEEEDFEAAIEHCDDALAVFGESAEALELRSKAVAAKDEVRRQRELKRRALQVVKGARAEFAAGQQEAALARLEQFSPPHDLIARALEELRKELQSSTQARAQKEGEAETEKRRREAPADQTRPMAVGPTAEPAQRRLKLSTEKGRIEELLGRFELDAAERALAAAEKKFESSAEFRPLRERLDSLRGAQHDEFAQNAELEAAAEEQRQAEARELARKAAAEAQVAAEAEAKARENEETQRVQRRQEQLAREKQNRERQQARAATYAATSRQPIEQPKQFGGEDAGTAAPPPQPLRVIYVAGTRGRSWMASSVGVMVLLLTVGTWWAMKPTSAPNPPTRQQQVSRPPASNIPPGPSQAANPGEAVTPTVPDNPGQPTEPNEVNQRPPAVEQLPATTTQPPAVAGRGSEPLARRDADPAQLRTLEAFRSTASQQLKAGQRLQALDAAAAGLKIDPRDPTLNAVMRALLREAQEAAARSKQDATDLDADVRAEEAFNQGLQREKQAVSLRRTGRIDAAARSFWVAADRFKAAAEESSRIEAEEQARIKTKPIGPPPQTGLDQPQKPLNTDLEQPVVTQTLRRYEAAYAKLSANDVRSVYPSAPIDQLAKDFADYRAYTLKVEINEFKFYVFSETRTSVVVTSRVSHDVLTKSGQRTQFVRSQIFTLDKQGATWVIVQIR
jgi:TIR domain